MRIFIGVLVFALLDAAIAAEPQTYRFDPAISIVTGTVAVESFYGAPNYGESPSSDSLERSYILELDSPIQVVGDPSDELNAQSFGHVTRIQLAAVDGNLLASYVGFRTVVTGKLFQHFTGHHHTDILMAVDHIELANQ